MQKLSKNVKRSTSLVGNFPDHEDSFFYRTLEFLALIEFRYFWEKSSFLQF